MRYAEVAVNAAPAHPRTFSYSVPPRFTVHPGHAVWVPFGPRLVQGIVIELTADPAVAETRDIAQVIGSDPILKPYQIELARWVAERYLSSYFDAAALMLPPGFERRVLTYLRSTEGVDEESVASLTPRQTRVMEAVRDKGTISLDELSKSFKGGVGNTTISQLTGKGLIVRTLEIDRPKVRPRFETFIDLGDREAARAALPELEKKRAHRQAELLRFLIDRGQRVPLRDVRQKLGVPRTAADALERRGLVSLVRIHVQRDPLAHREYPGREPPILTELQDSVWSRICEAMRNRLSEGKTDSPDTFLLHGVTGSGKTEIYLRALQQAIDLGRKAIVLVPEIALTPQTIARFAERFPGRVAVLHSKLSLGEQYDQWHLIRDGMYDVVIGSRGALFAPQPDLGLIVMDEEHEWTYKQQEQSPRYHARDAALALARLTGSLLILGSATPSLESYHRAGQRDCELLTLPERIPREGVSGMPEVEIVDLRRELREGNRSILSRSLSTAIARVLDAGEQAILFLNRRGTATFVQCRNCGYVVRCRRCETTLTYHSDEHDLVCHQCNYRTPPPGVCPNCRSRRIRYLGTGTQRVEEEVASAFPRARTLRWDRDVTKGRYSHERILDRFLSHEADVLIGTQMIAKGLDMPLVTLVGIVNADIGLYLPDFRASERTFQILAQVAGRAGRSSLGGRVIVQTYTPEHYSVVTASRHDYATFYEHEIAFRRQEGDPPFRRLARLVYIHTNFQACEREARRLYRILQEKRDSLGLPGTDLLGPSPAFIQRVRGRYRWQIIVRSPDPTPLLADLSLPSRWTIDIDPVSLT